MFIKLNNEKDKNNKLSEEIKELKNKNTLMTNILKNDIKKIMMKRKKNKY